MSIFILNDDAALVKLIFPSLLTPCRTFHILGTVTRYYAPSAKEKGINPGTVPNRPTVSAAAYSAKSADCLYCKTCRKYGHLSAGCTTNQNSTKETDEDKNGNTQDVNGKPEQAD